MVTSVCASTCVQVPWKHHKLEGSCLGKGGGQAGKLVQLSLSQPRQAICLVCSRARSPAHQIPTPALGLSLVQAHLNFIRQHLNVSPSFCMKVAFNRTRA
jgi:hypothetical protein